MLEIVPGIIDHPDFFHDPPRLLIEATGKRNDYRKAQFPKSKLQNPLGPFRRQAFPPMGGGQPPSYFDAGRKRRLECRNRQANEADHFPGCLEFGGPKAESFFLEGRPDPRHQGTCLVQGQRGRKKLHDLWIRINVVKGFNVLRLPPAKDQARGHKVFHRAAIIGPVGIQCKGWISSFSPFLSFPLPEGTTAKALPSARDWRRWEPWPFKRTTWGWGPSLNWAFK